MPADAVVTAKDIAAQRTRLRRYALALIGNLADADDLVQDTVERALIHKASLRDPARLGSWLLAILHNRHASGLRTRRRRGPEVPVDGLADELATGDTAFDQARLTDFARALDRLSDEQRQVLLLVSLEGLSYREAGEALGLPIGTVMSRLSRARERLRVLLEGGEEQAVRRIR